MRIAFDGTTLRPGRTGVGYYTEHLLRHVVDEGCQHAGARPGVRCGVANATARLDAHHGSPGS
jgi:hypothetical protein